MWNIRRVFILALAIRLGLAPFATLSATFENITAVDTIFVQGFNPLSWITSYGPGFYVFYAPLYVPYFFLKSMGVQSLFILEFLFKFPSIVGDMLSGYALFNLALRVLQNSRRAMLLSTAYLLNPYSIFISAVVGHLEPLMIGLVLMSIYSTFEPSPRKSSIFLSLASTLRFLPGLLLPFFLLYLRGRAPLEARIYLYYFATFSAILFSPYLLVIIPLRLASQPLLFGYLQSFGGPVSTLGQSNPSTFRYNLTGFLASTGLWGYASNFSNVWTFIVLYVGLTAAFWRFTRSDLKALTSFAGVFFSMFMLVVPLSQSHYLSWFLPFGLIGSFIYASIPRKYIGLLLGVNMTIWPLIDPGFLVVLDATFPWITGYGYLYNHWPFTNLDLLLSLSVLYAVILTLCLILLLVSATRPHEFDYAKQPNPRLLPTLVVAQIAVLVFEMLRLAYFQTQTYLSLVAIIAAISILAAFTAKSRHDFAFEGNFRMKNIRTNSVILLGLSGLMLALSLNSNSVFLLIQAGLTAFLAFIRQSKTKSMLGQATIVWCSGYIAYLSLTSTNSLEAVLTIPTLFVIIAALLSQFYVRTPLPNMGPLPQEGR